MHQEHPGLLCVGDRLETVNGESVVCQCCGLTDRGFVIERSAMIDTLATRPNFRRVWTDGLTCTQAISDEVE